MMMPVMMALLSLLPLWVAGSRVDYLLNRMTIEQKIGQMTQIDISVFLNSSIPGGVDYDKMSDWISEYHIGSILNSPFSMGTFQEEYGWDAATWRSVLNKIQTLATQNSEGIPILYGIDSIHGANYVKGATLFPQQINTAAGFNTTTANLIGLLMMIYIALTYVRLYNCTRFPRSQLVMDVFSSAGPCVAASVATLL